MKILISICLLGFTLYGNQTIKISQNQQIDLGVKIQKAKSVNTIELGPYSGTVVLDKKDIISIGSNIESIVKNIYVRELEHIEKGQKLITLESNALLDLQQEYIEAILEFENLNQNHERDLKLQAAGIISNKRLLESKKLQRGAELKVKLISNQLLTNSFSKKMLENLKNTQQPVLTKTIYASRSGLINDINVNVGEYVLREHKMMEFYADGRRFIELVVPVQNIKNISIGDRCVFSTYNAKITAIGNVVNTASQSVVLKAVIEDSKDILINRVYEVKIIKNISGAVKVKKSALVFEEDRAYLFKKVAGGFEVIDAKIISEGPNCYIVEADLKDDDELAVTSTSALLSAMDGQNE